MKLSGEFARDRISNVYTQRRPAFGAYFGNPQNSPCSTLHDFIVSCDVIRACSDEGHGKGGLSGKQSRRYRACQGPSRVWSKPGQAIAKPGSQGLLCCPEAEQQQRVHSTDFQTVCSAQEKVLPWPVICNVSILPLNHIPPIPSWGSIIIIGSYTVCH